MATYGPAPTRRAEFIDRRFPQRTGAAHGSFPPCTYRAPHGRQSALKLSLRLVAACLFAGASLVLLLTALPQGEAKSYAPPRGEEIDFIARWSAVDAPAKRANTVATQRISPSAVAARPGRETNASGPTADAAAPRVQLAYNRAAIPLPPPPQSHALATSVTKLVPFASAPFPYDGVVPTTDEPFLNVAEGEDKGHRTRRGRVLWEDKTFSDNRVLLHIPSGFDINKPAVMVAFFHGHHAELSRDVLRRQQVAEQISMSGVNAVLVAPQFAVDAADSSPGRFWEPGGFARFVKEAGEQLARLYGDSAKAKQFETMPVVIVAYSGGYLPAAWSIKNGGLGRRLHGVVLLDALYAQQDVFARWIKNSPSAFLVSAYTGSTRRHNLDFARILNDEKIPFSTTLNDHLWRGRVALLSTDDDVKHRDFVTKAWTDNPIRDLLDKLN